MAAEPSYVFVSYASEDADVVRSLAQALEGRGISIRFDRDIRAGAAWQVQLKQWLDDAGAVLVVWSPHSLTNANVISEATQALNRLVPVKLADMSVVPRPFQNLQTFDLSGWSGDPGDSRLDRLGRDLHDRLARSAGSRTSATTSGEYEGSAETATSLAAAAGIADPAERSRVLTSVARAMVATDSAAAASVIDLALSSAQSIPDGAERSRVLRELAELLSGIDPQRADDVMRQSLATDPERRGVPTDEDVKAVAGEDQQTSAVGTAPIGGTPLAPETVFDFNADTPGLAGAVRASDDQLGIEDDVRVLCQLAMARSTKPPLAIGLFGDWGTGKSFFMRRMQTRVQEMQQEAGSLLACGGTSHYCDNVVQVPFNAWHYVDSNLWASLMTRIFEVLGERTPDKARDYLFSQLESTQGRLTQARRDKSEAWQQIDELRKERSRLSKIQSAISGQHDEPVRQLIETLAKLNLSADQLASPLPEGVTTLADLHEAAQGVRSTARLLERLLNSWPFRLLLVGAVLIVLGGLGVIAAGGGDLLRRALSVAAVVLPTVAAAAGVAWRRFRNVVDLASRADDVEQWITSQLAALDERDRSLAADVKRAQGQADQAVRTIDSVRTGNLIRQYVENRVTNEAYRDQLGVISLVRSDLQRLSELCSPTEDGPSVFSMTARFDIQRVILYIDDLDRCPPDRVVEVLQAVHLLLAFPLFVVVVGVDSRWLITSLNIHYQRLLHDDDRGGQAFSIDTGQWEASPADYLDKIFQIPLALRPMSDGGYRALVKNLMPVCSDTEGESSPARHDDAAAPASDSRNDAAVPVFQAAPPTLLMVREVRQFAVEGDTLAIRFAVDGKRLIVVTSAGIWVWNQGATGDSRYATAQIQDVHFSPDGGQLLYETSEDWVAVDLATAGQFFYPRPSGVVALAVGEESYEVIYATDSALVRLCGQEMQSTAWPNETIGQLVVAGERLLARCASGLWAVRLPDLSDIRPLSAEATGTIIDIALHPRDRTLYTLNPGEMRIWSWSGDGWDPGGRVEVPVEHSHRPPDRLAVSNGGVFIQRADNLLHVMRPRFAISSLAISETPAGETALSADPSTERFVFRSGPTLIVGQHDSTGLSEQSRWEVAALDAVALAPGGSLVATAGGGSYQLWYIGDQFVEEDISQLELGPEEAEFVAALGPVVPTARTAKRLVNVYRVLRASKVGQDKLREPASGEYKVALLLLSLVTGWPHLALPVLRELETGTAQTWPELLAAVRKKRSAQDGARFERGSGRENENDEILGKFQQAFEEVQITLDRYRVWVPEISRFSVPANDYVTSLPR
jgi:hypothetical protein